MAEGKPEPREKKEAMTGHNFENLEVCHELGIDSFKGTSEMIEETREISKMLGSLIHRLTTT
jgi:hypothetical protein